MNALLKFLNKYIVTTNPIILGGVFAILFAFCLNVPLWGNMLLAFGSLAQTDYIAGFPANIMETEYLRGYFYKLLMYGVMKTTDLFISWDHYYSYQQLAKFFYYIFCFGLSFFFLKISLKNSNLKQVFTLWLGFWIIMLLSNYRQFLEAEEFAVILALGHFLFIYSTNKRLNQLSGIFVLLLFGCKTITILYAGFGLLYLLFIEWENKEKIKQIILSHFLFTLLAGVLYATYLYPEIENIRRAVSYQDSMGFRGIATILRFLKQFIEFSTFLPVVMILPFALYYSITKGVRYILLFFFLFVLSSSVVILQNRFSSPYHYLSFLPMVLLFMFLIKNDVKALIYITLLGALAYIGFQNFNHTTYLEYASNNYYKDYFNKQLVDYNNLNSTLKTLNAKEILFVSGDSPPYYVHQKSANKQCSAMLLFRGVKKESVRESERFKEFYASYVNYQGEFILLDRLIIDIESPYFKELKDKINLNYKEIFRFKNTPKAYDAADVSLYQKL